MALPKVSITLPQISYLGGQEITGTLTGKDPARFYTWGWSVSDASGGGLGEGSLPVQPAQTTLSIVPNTFYPLQRYGQASFGMTVDEWTSDPGYPVDYNSPAYVGSSSASAIIYRDTAGLPVITSANLSEGNPVVTAAAIGAYVQGVSTVSWDIVATGSDGGAPASYEITIDGVLYRGKSGTSGVLASSGSKTVTTKVTDVAGRIQTRSDTINVLAYSAPKITSYDAFRATSAGVASDTGTYLRISFAGSASSLVVGTEKNSTSFIISTRPLGGAWTQKGSGAAALAPTATITPSGYPVDASYEVRLTVSDKLTTVAGVTFVAKGGIVLDLGPGNVGIGKEWQQGVLDVGGDIWVDGVVHASSMDLGSGAINAGFVGAAEVSAGSVVTSPRIRLTSTSDVSPTSTNHALQIGPDDGQNLILDQNEIMVRNGDGTTTRLYSEPGYSTGGASVAVGGIGLAVSDSRISGTHYPWAVASGVATSAAGAWATVTLPSGRFSVAPNITVTNNGISAADLNNTAMFGSVTTTQFITRASSGTRGGTLNWIAIQMNSGSASG